MQAIFAVQSIGHFAISGNVNFFCSWNTEQTDKKEVLNRKTLKGEVLQLFIEMLQKKLSLLLKKTLHNLPKQELIKIQKLGSEHIGLFTFLKNSVENSE